MCIFFKIFNLIVKPCTIRVILSLTIMHHQTIRQLNVNNAFFNGILMEDVFIHQLEGFIHPQYSSHTCKLTKALYGLKQAPKTQYDRLKSSVLPWDLSYRNQIHHCSFIIWLMISLSYLFMLMTSYSLDQTLSLLKTLYISWFLSLL